MRYLKINFLILRKNTFRFLTNKIEPKTYILISSLIVGLLSGFAAVALKSVVHFFQRESKAVLNSIGTSFLIYFFPLIGIIISILIIKFIFKGKITTGLSDIIHSIIRKKSNIPAGKIFSSLLTSGATVGMGGSVGLEAPIVVIGASIGSNVAKELKFNYHHKTLLLACGSAAGISAIFNSPIAGVIFAIEVLLPDITVSSFIPLLIASASSAVLSKIIYSGQLFFLVTSGWHFYAIPYYILLGLLCGFISLYMIRITLAIETRAAKIKNQFHKVLLGGMLLCFLIFLLPPLFGEGYSTIITLLAGKNYDILSNTFFKTFLNPDLLLIIFIVIIILTKVIATSLTIGAGGNGGIIAPSLFTGALTGFLLAHTLRYLRIIDLDQANFIVVGMAGILAGVLHAPLTGIFLIAEITGGYALIIPLMIVTSISFFISKHFNKYSVYTAALAHQGIDFRSKNESFSVQNISLYNLVEKNYYKLYPNMKFRDLVDKITHSSRNLFPVVDKEDKLLGVITLDDVREVMLDIEIYDVLLANEIMNSEFITIDINSDINTVLKIFDDNNILNIAVTQNKKFVGFISKSNLFNKYISLLDEQRKNEI